MESEDIGAHRSGGIPDRVIAVLVALVFASALAIAYLPVFAPGPAAGLGLHRSVDDLREADRLVQFGGIDRAEPVLSRGLEKAPLSQHGVYLLYRLADAGKLVDAKADKILPVMRGLGWKDPDAQIVLLLAAEQRGDYRELVMRADALLRRAPATRDVHALLYELEGIPAARKVMIQRMALDPVWRGYFFRLFRPEDKEDILNHLALLDEMRRSGSPLKAEDVSFAINKAVDLGETDAAYNFWKRNNGSVDRVAANKPDSDAESNAAFVAQTSSYFDWNAKSGVGQSFYQAGVDSASAVGLEWNGRGAPLLLTRIMAAPRKRGYLKVVIDGGAEKMNRFQFQFRCGRWIEPLYLKPDGRSGIYRSQTLDRAEFECDYPMLEISGAPQPVDRPTSVTFNAVDMIDID